MLSRRVQTPYVNEMFRPLLYRREVATDPVEKATPKLRADPGTNKSDRAEFCFLLGFP